MRSTLLSLLLVLPATGIAHAGEPVSVLCNTVETTSGDDIVILGRKWEFTPVEGDYGGLPYATAVPAACIHEAPGEDFDGGWRFKTLGCGYEDLDDDEDIEGLILRTFGGKDLVVFHQGLDSDWFPCDDTGFALGPWKDFLLPIQASLGGGSDRYFGTANPDTVYSNDNDQLADEGFDLVCSEDGGDRLFGDATDTMSDRECFVAGKDSVCTDPTDNGLSDLDTFHCESSTGGVPRWTVEGSWNPLDCQAKCDTLPPYTPEDTGL